PTPAVDLYALGIMIFELASGRRPFDGPGLEVTLAHLEHEPPRLRDVVSDAPPPYDELCWRLLRKDAATRATLNDVARALGLGTRTSLRPRSWNGGAPAILGRELVQRALAARIDA